MLRSSTPVGPGSACHDAHPTALRRAFRSSEVVGSHGDQDYGAQSRSLQTRCLRFAGRVTPPPRKTRFGPVASLPGGIGYPQGSPNKVSTVYIVSSLTEPRGATELPVLARALLLASSRHPLLGQAQALATPIPFPERPDISESLRTLLR